MSKQMKIIVICSLFLNVLLAGVILGHLSTRLKSEELPPRPGQELAGKLSPDKLKLFEESMRRVHGKNREIIKQIEEEREKTLILLTEPEFNESAYQAEVKKLHDLRGQTMQNLANVTIDMARHFSLEERKALAEMLKRPPRLPLPPPPPDGPGRPDMRELPPRTRQP